MTTPCTSFSTPRSVSRERVRTAADAAVDRIDELSSKITASITRLEKEIGTILSRMDAHESKARCEKQAHSAEVAMLHRELSILQSKVDETDRIARESLQIAKDALDHAQNHAHRYNIQYDWRTARAYKCDPATPQWEI